MTTEESTYITAGQEPTLRANDDAKPSLREILKERNFWGIALPRFFADPVWGTLNYWVPLYLYQARGFDLKALAMMHGCPSWLLTLVA